jgi:uncharacterized protein YecT (DUF1311 family)
MKITTIFALTFLIATQSFSQTKNTVDSLQNEEQKCLDKGQYMLGCSLNFYNQMDSLLNVVYFKLYHSLDTSNQGKLKKEQKLWLTKRDKIFKLNAQKTHEEAVKDGFDGGQDERMILADKNATVVKQRVLELIGRLKK